MNGYLICVESNTSGSGIDFIKKAHALGFKTLLLSNDLSRYPWASDLTPCEELNTNDLSALKSFVAGFEHDVSGLITSSEYYVLTVALLALEFGLPGPAPKAIQAARTKNEMRNILKSSGLNALLHTTISAEIDPEEALADFTFPVVVKPVSGSGSENVVLCKNIEEVSKKVGEILSVTHNARAQREPDYVLIEEYIDGSEFSVEVYCGAEPQVITVVDKHLSEPPYFLETGHDLPADLDQETQSAIEAEALGAVKALGLDFGCIHVELRLSSKGPVIIEVNPRLAGGMIPSLIENSFGLDMIDLQIRSALDLDKLQALSPVLKQHSSIRFLIPPRAGKIKNLKGLEDVQAMDGVLRAYTDTRLKTFEKNTGSFTDRVGAIIMAHDDPVKLKDIAEQALKTIEFIYEE